MEFLEFELPIKEIIEQIDKYKSKKDPSIKYQGSCRFGAVRYK